jgi:hypothetical protein
MTTVKFGDNFGIPEKLAITLVRLTESLQDHEVVEQLIARLPFGSRALLAAMGFVEQEGDKYTLTAAGLTMLRMLAYIDRLRCGLEEYSDPQAWDGYSFLEATKSVEPWVPAREALDNTPLSVEQKMRRSRELHLQLAAQEPLGPKGNESLAGEQFLGQDTRYLGDN